ncbi:MAG: hypothetical protein AB1430_18780 [Pseudomonadota bacterium]
MHDLPHPAPPAALEQSLRRYLTLALTCHELFAVTLDDKRPAQHAAMDELLRALGQPPGPPDAGTGRPLHS